MMDSCIKNKMSLYILFILSVDVNNNNIIIYNNFSYIIWTGLNLNKIKE